MQHDIPTHIQWMILQQVLTNLDLFTLHWKFTLANVLKCEVRYSTLSKLVISLKLIIQPNGVSILRHCPDDAPIIAGHSA